jgi:hypothetical protein
MSAWLNTGAGKILSEVDGFSVTSARGPVGCLPRYATTVVVVTTTGLLTQHSLYTTNIATRQQITPMILPTVAPVTEPLVDESENITHQIVVGVTRYKHTKEAV